MRNASRGFTLIELMIAVVVVAILTAIAVPSYTSYTRKAHRADAQNYLMTLAQANAQYFIDNRGYATDPTALNNPVPSSVSPYYALQNTPPITVTASPPGFSIRITPTGGQAADTCGWLQIDNAGAKTSQSGSTSCW